MKILLLILLAFPVFTFSQTITKDTIDRDYYNYNKLIGKEVVWNESKDIYKGESVITEKVWRSTQESWPQITDSIIYPAKNSNFTLADSLNGKRFLCIGTKSVGISILVKLYNKKTGPIVVNLYDNYRPFKTAEELQLEKYHEENPCSTIVSYDDDLRQLKTFHTPYDLETSDQVWITKIKELGKKDRYYVNIRVFEPVGKTVNGAYIMLQNGKRIAKPNQEVELEIDKEKVDISHPGYIQQVSIRMNDMDLAVLKSSPISKLTFSYFKPMSIDGVRLYKMLLCLLSK